MNYYEHHIGDYSEATAHLSFVEDAAYCRLMRKYYATERPLPGDLKQLQRLVGARTKEEKFAVEVVLEEFFYFDDGVWRNKRCDLEIANYLNGKPEREIKKANETNRLKLHREERAALFKRLTDAGHHATWNVGIAKLRELVKRYCDKPETASPPLPATAPATPATATHTPDTIHQTPEYKTNSSKNNIHVADPPVDSQDLKPNEHATRKGELCKKLRLGGIDAAPHMQAWPELLSCYSDAEILAAAESAREKKPGERIHLNYLLPILRNRAPPKTQSTPKSNSRQARIDNYAAQAAEARAKHEKPPDGNDRIIDAEVIRVA